MQNNKQYLLIGSFVISGFALIVAILLWFSASSRNSYNTYRVIFHESVDGVTTSSVVKYNGVEVGKVHRVALDDKNPNNVLVDIDVVTTLAITSNTYATLKSQGVTGMSYISLSQQNESGVVLTPHNTLPYPIIPAKSSFLTNLTEQAQNIGTNIKDVSGQFKMLLSDKNVEHFGHVIENLDNVTTAISSQSDNIEKSIGVMTQVLNNVNQNTAHLDEAIIQFTALSKSLQSNSAKFDNVMDSVQNDTLRNINMVLLPNLNQSVVNMNNATSQFNELLKMVNQNPSVFIRGKSAPQLGPGE